LLFNQTPLPLIDTNFFFNVGIIKKEDCGLPSTNLATDIDQ